MRPASGKDPSIRLSFVPEPLCFHGFSTQTALWHFPHFRLFFRSHKPLRLVAASPSFADYPALRGHVVPDHCSQRKRQKQHEQMLTELKTGDEVVTSGGIYGTITNVKDDRFVVRIADNTKIELSKSSIGSRVSQADA